jgi:phosphodiesterase/alkaline phosphatase D-like protein
VRNPVVLTGDWHSSWVNDLKADWADPASATVATEFVGTSISSGCPWAPDVARAVAANPQMRFFDGDRRGWVRCTVTPSEWRSDYRVVAAADDASGPAETLTSWTVEDGRRRNPPRRRLTK